MLVKTVETVVATNSAGQPVDSIPVRIGGEGETSVTGQAVDVISVEESATGVPVRIVAGKTAQNSAGSWIDSLPVVVLVTEIGGIAIGTVGEAGIYNGYELVDGDDFASLDVLAPHRPRGDYFTTRVYLPGARGNDGALGTQYDTDPYFTGHNDSNKGVPVGYDNMSVSGSVLSLVARKATAGEKTHMVSSRNEVTAMIATPGRLIWYAGAQGTEDIIIEARIRLDANAPAGWHPTFWTLSLNPAISGESDEIDHEGNSEASVFSSLIWTAGSPSGSGAGSGTPFAHDGQFHTISFKMNTTQLYRSIDGVNNGNIVRSANNKSKPAYMLLTNHIVSSAEGFEGDIYSQSEWNADANGAYFEIDWWRAWCRPGKAVIRPVVEIADVNVDYGASTVITLPSKAAIWGDGTVDEYLQVVYAEENEPGVTHSTVFDQFPAGVSYNSGTREITINITSGKTGRLNFVLAGWKPGHVGNPLRFAVNVGPVAALPEALLSGIDLYALQDCGVLTSNGVTKAKTVTIDGLAGSGLTYSDATGLITGTPVPGTYALTVTVTNSLGQIDSISGNVDVEGFDVAGWSSVIEWWDASDNATVFSDATATTPAVAGSSAAGALVGKKLGAVHSQSAAGQQPDYVTDANGKKCIRFVRANNDAMRTQNATVVAEVTGDDNAFVVLGAFKRGTPDESVTPFSFGPDTGSVLTYIRAFFGSTDNVGMNRIIAGVSTSATSGNDIVSVDRWYTVAWIFKGTTLSVRVDGVNVLTDASLNTATIGTIQRMVLGGRYDDNLDSYNATVAFNGCVGELMLIAGGITEANTTLHQAEAYLMAKWTN